MVARMDAWMDTKLSVDRLRVKDNEKLFETDFFSKHECYFSSKQHNPWERKNTNEFCWRISLNRSGPVWCGVVQCEKREGSTSF